MAVYTVSQVTRYLRESLERDALLADLWVSGEVSNLSTSVAGHTYFTLKDGQGQLRCVLFRSGKGADLLANGTAVLAHGRITLYEARGETNLLVDIVLPEGTGALYLELERLKARLEQEGLFEPSRKRPLPTFPQVIGLVTSPTGAVLHDICTILQRRYPLVELVLAPTPVQGEEAAPGIVAAIQALNRQPAMDLILLARGGGSLEELWPFNEEVVARAIYASHAPVVSAVGHETDVTIADLVADLRAPTPSAAAELVVPDGGALRQEVLALQERGQRAIQDWLTAQRQAAGWLAQRLQGRAPNVATARLRVDGLLHSTFQDFAGRLALLHERLSGMELRLQALSPQHILSRGYAVVQRQPQGEVVSRTAQVASGDELKVTISDGSFPARVAKGAPPKQSRRKQQVYAGKPLF